VESNEQNPQKKPKRDINTGARIFLPFVDLRSSDGIYYVRSYLGRYDVSEVALASVPSNITTSNVTGFVYSEIKWKPLFLNRENYMVLLPSQNT
jgi:hypothetical protein